MTAHWIGRYLTAQLHRGRWTMRPAPCCGQTRRDLDVWRLGRAARHVVCCPCCGAGWEMVASPSPQRRTGGREGT